MLELLRCSSFITVTHAQSGKPKQLIVVSPDSEQVLYSIASCDQTLPHHKIIGKGSGYARVQYSPVASAGFVQYFLDYIVLSRP